MYIEGARDVRIRQEPGSPVTQEFLDKCKFGLGLSEVQAIEYRRTILEHLPPDAMFVEKCSIAHAKPQTDADKDLFIVEDIVLEKGNVVVVAQKIPQHTAV